MSVPERPISRVYTEGDVILLRATFTHVRYIESLMVVYGRDGGYENTITFIDDAVQSVPQTGEVRYGVGGLPIRTSRTVLRMVVDPDHRKGNYHLLAVTYSTDGHMINLLPLAELGAPSFRIVMDTNEETQIDLELIDESDVEEPEE